MEPRLTEGVDDPGEIPLDRDEKLQLFASQAGHRKDGRELIRNMFRAEVLRGANIK